MSRRFTACALLLLVTACATPNPAREHRTPEWKQELAAGTRSRSEPLGELAEALVEPVDSTPNPVEAAATEPLANSEPSVVDRPDLVAVVGGNPITAAELLVHWLHHESDVVIETLDQIAYANIILLEASRLGIRVSEDRLETAQREADEDLRARIQRETPGLSIDEFVRRRLGLNADNFRRRQRHYTILSLLRPMVVRSWFLETEHALARMIPVGTRERLAELQERLAAGGSFKELAREFSIEPGEESRGELLPIVRENSLISDMVFSTPEGTIGGPFEQTGAFVLVQVESRGMGVKGSWSEIGDAVRASLAERDVSPLEYMQWTQAARDRHRVDYGPFLELVGERPVTAPAPATREKP